MGTRQRQVKQNQASENVDTTNCSTSDKTKYLQDRQKSSKGKYLIVAAVGILTLMYAGALTGLCTIGNKFVDKAVASLNLHTPTYVIIIDAGSTGSRINLFTFHNNILNGQLVLDDTLFFETKPGLSSFAKSAEDVGKSLNVLLDKAREKIPKSQWSSTPLLLRATAGLRLLKDNHAQKILDECKRVLASSGFKVTEDSVAIMDGSDEGIYSWFTTNFLLDRFGDETSSTVAAFDLGGGSNQITFSVTADAFDPQSPHAKNIHHVNAFDRNISVFTESFLGMGLMAARKEILTHPDNGNTKTKVKGVKDVELSAECIDPTLSEAKWNYAGKNYIVKGLTGQFTTCIDIVKKVVNAAIPHDLPSLRGHEIYAFSYYFERMEEAGLIEPDKGGAVTVESIHQLANKVCENPKADEPFMCLDLSFIYALLHEGFGLDKSSKIFMHKYIDGHQLNWALGAAFNLLQSNA